MQRNLAIIQALISVLIMVTILLQNRGTGLSETFGGGGDGGNSYQTKRGFDKFLVRLTATLVVLFVMIAIYSLTQD